MACVVKKTTPAGTRCWYGKYKDRDGVWRTIPTDQPSRSTAASWIVAYQKRIDKEGEPREDMPIGDLMPKWLDSIENRSADNDRSRASIHLLPVFRSVKVQTLTKARIIEWLDTMKEAKTISSATQRHCLNLLSRFLSWCEERGYASVNQVKLIPQRSRPKQAPKENEAPWIEDDQVVRTLISALPEPHNYIFYIGNRSGLRLGEILGLRMSDLAELAEGRISVRYSYDGPLKEDRGRDATRKMKWAPAATDAAVFLKPWLDRRLAEGAQPEDLVFVSPRTRKDGTLCYCKTGPERAWRKTLAKLKKEKTLDLGDLTLYEATRHSFTSRTLKAHGRLEEVSSAIGHASVATTQRHYNRYVIKDFSPTLREGLGLKAEAGKVVHLPRRGARFGARPGQR